MKGTAPAAVLAVALIQPATSEFVELDVVALDHQDFAVAGLTRQDFEIRDGGRLVAIQTFAEVSAHGAGVDDERSVILLMDDIGVPTSGTSAMRAIARVLLAPTRDADEIAVVRVSRARDEAYGDIESARERIDQYHGGAIPFSPTDTPETVLQAVARVADALEPIEHRRKALVCLGLPSVCDVAAPVAASSAAYRNAWRRAVSAAARANASVYGVDPTGLTSRSGAVGEGLLRLTGGELLHNSNDFAAAAARIWREASRYYLIGYSAAAPTDNLRTVDVKTTRRDVHVRVRRLR